MENEKFFITEVLNEGAEPFKTRIRVGIDYSKMEIKDIIRFRRNKTKETVSFITSAINRFGADNKLRQKIKTSPAFRDHISALVRVETYMNTEEFEIRFGKYQNKLIEDGLLGGRKYQIALWPGI